MLRILRLAKRLEATLAGVSLYDLSKELGVTTRTIRRDIVILEELGASVYVYRSHADDQRAYRRLQWTA